MEPLLVFGLVMALSLGFNIIRLILLKRREAYLSRYAFPPGIAGRVLTRYPHLTHEQLDLVLDGLRQFLLLCGRSRRRMVSMPSQVVDVAWHEFILFTRNYDLFCRQALGRFLHHTPAEAMRSPTQAQDGIKRAWRLACQHEAINPKKPDRLPLLFAIDRLLNIPDGFRYAVDCRLFAADGNVYCGSDIGCGGGCGGDSGSDSGDGDGGGDGGCGGGGD